MHAEEIAGCCALRAIGDVDCLGSKDAYSKKQAEKFPNGIETTGEFGGDQWTASILVLSDGSDWEDEDEHSEWYERAVKVLEAKGWKELGKFPGAHGDYWDHLWGSKEFILAQAKKAKRN